MTSISVSAVVQTFLRYTQSIRQSPSALPLRRSILAVTLTHGYEVLHPLIHAGWVYRQHLFDAAVLVDRLLSNRCQGSSYYDHYEGASSRQYGIGVCTDHLAWDRLLVGVVGHVFF